MKVIEVKDYRPGRLDVEPDGMVAVYDLTVEGSHLYFVSPGVLVSNSKRISMLDVNALMAHGATETLRDAGAIRGQKDERRWLQFMQGYNPTEVKVPMVYEKFVNQLKASGINVVRKGNQTNVMAMTSKDVESLAGDRVITSGDTVHFDKDLKPVPGGLFDPKLTGGHGGRQWSKIKLDEAMPNPVMEEPIRRILGLTGKQYEAVMSGDHDLPRFGSGPAAISKALENINLTKEIGMARAQMKAARGSKRDEAVRRLGFLKSADDMGLHPREWVLDHVPVLPPAFRPVSLMGSSGMPLVSDPNYLYKELLEADKNLKEMKVEVGDKGAGAERLAVYQAFKAVTGLGEPVHPKLQEKGVKGILKSVFGTSPKFGTVQRKLLSSTVDNVGRAVITPNPDYDMDTVGVPEGKAFDVYSKFIVRRLTRRGMSVAQALDHVKDKTDLARDILQEEMNDRPVYINRAPVLHKFGIMAFRPQLVKGDVLQVSPLIVKGFGADFDGDAMQFHVPTTDEAKKEALERMLPSSNLLSPADFKTPVHAPGQEYLGGLYHASTARSKARPRIFRNKKDAMAAAERGEITADTPIRIMEG
jgi:DNA-directed RNA polymerase beta' subunit